MARKTSRMLLLISRTSLLLLLLLAQICKGMHEEGDKPSPSSGSEDPVEQLPAAPSQASPHSSASMHPKSVTTIAHFDDHTEVVSASTSSSTHAYITPDSLKMTSMRLFDDDQSPEATKASQDGDKTASQVVAGKEADAGCGACAGKKVAIAQLGVHVPKEKNVRTNVVRAMANIMGPSPSSSTNESGVGEAAKDGVKDSGMTVDEQEEFNRILLGETERLSRFRSTDDDLATVDAAELVADKPEEEASKTAIEPDEPSKEKEPPSEPSPQLQHSSEPSFIDRSKGEAAASVKERQHVWGEFDEIPEGMSQSDVHQML